MITMSDPIKTHLFYYFSLLFYLKSLILLSFFSFYLYSIYLSIYPFLISLLIILLLLILILILIIIIKRNLLEFEV
ncbi:hypothetical protein BJ944DRAFT_263232, partial [Cunninghamella echinulata]